MGDRLGEGLLYWKGCFCMTSTKKLIERAKNLFSSEIGVFNMNEISDTIDELVEYLERHERALEKWNNLFKTVEQLNGELIIKGFVETGGPRAEIEMTIDLDELNQQLEAILNPQEKGGVKCNQV